MNDPIALNEAISRAVEARVGDMVDLLKDALRYRWIRQHGAWETEAFLNGLSPEEYDAAVDRQMHEWP